MEVTQAACQKPELRAFFKCSIRQGSSPSSSDDIDAPDAVALGREQPGQRQTQPTMPSAHQKLMPRVSVNCR